MAWQGIYIYIHWSPIQYLERCFISYRFFFDKVTHVGLIFFFLLVTRGVWASLRAPQLIPGLTEHLASPVSI